jgi:hypothetical protein
MPDKIALGGGGHINLGSGTGDLLLGQNGGAFRSMLAFWMGGAGRTSVVAASGGFSSMFAFWMGGAAPGAALGDTSGTRRMRQVPAFNQKRRRIGGRR